MLCFVKFILPFFCFLGFCHGSGCPGNWTADSSTPPICYFIPLIADHQWTYGEAKNICSSNNNAIVPTFNNDIEYKNFTNFLINSPPVGGQPTRHDFWLALWYVNASNKYLWNGVSDANFSWWLTGQPTSSNPCVTTDNAGTSYRWVSHTCDTNLNVVCQLRNLSMQTTLYQTTTKTVATTTASCCPDGYLSDNVSQICYLYRPTASTWQSAFNDCLSIGNNLPKFQTPDEFKWLLQYVQITFTATGDNFWIGMYRNVTPGVDHNNMPGAASSSFEWYDGTPYYQNGSWGYTEPNALGDAAQTCVGLYHGWNYSWDDFYCTDPRYHFCQCRSCYVCSAATTAVSVSVSQPQSTMPSSATTTTTVSPSVSQSKGVSSSMSVSQSNSMSRSFSQPQWTSTTINARPSTNNNKQSTAMMETTKTKTTDASGTPKIKITRTLGKTISTTPRKSTKGQQNDTVNTLEATTFAVPQNCIVGEWEAYSACSVTCGGNGQSTRTRKILQSPVNGGQQCPALETSDPCSTDTACLPLTPLEQVVAQVLDETGCIYIIGQLTASLIVALILRSFSHGRLLQMGQEISLLLAHTLILVFRGYHDKIVVCKVVVTLLQYLFLVNFLFITFEALQCYVVLSNVLSHGKLIPIQMCYFSAFGLTWIPTLLTSFIGWNNLRSPFTCWLNLDSGLSMGTFIPLFTIIAVGVVTWESIGPHQFGENYFCPSGLYWEASVAKHALFFKIPINFAAWFIGVVTLHYQRITLHVLLLAMHIALGTTVLVFHTLGDQRVRHFAFKLWHRIKK